MGNREVAAAIFKFTDSIPGAQVNYVTVCIPQRTASLTIHSPKLALADLPGWCLHPACCS